MFSGDAGLATTFWPWMVGGSIGFYIAAFAADSSPAIIVVLLAAFFYFALILVGLHRAAVKYSGPAIWAVLAKIIVVIGWFSELATMLLLTVMAKNAVF